MNKRKTILAGVTAVAVILSSGVMAFAATDTAGTADSLGYPCKPEIKNGLTDDQMEAVAQARTDSMKEAVAQLVENGVITQEIADHLSEGRGMMKSKPTDLSTAEKQKTMPTLTDEQKAAFSQSAEQRKTSPLTEDQRTALQEAMKTILESKLAALVDDGTLTQEQADRFLNDGSLGHMGPGGMPGFGRHHEGKNSNSESESETQTF